jgi:hypothetical protein
MKLMLCSGFYEVKAFAPQIVSLIDAFRVLDELGIAYTYRQICGDSYVSRCKNAMVHEFLKSDYTHLMIIDSDETWEAEGFARLLRAALNGCEIVAGLYPCKNNWDFYGGYPKTDQETGYLLGKEIDDMRLLDMECVPGGFLIYSREAFERARPYLDSYFAPETGENILECFKNGAVFDLMPKSREELEAMSQEKLVDWAIANQQGGRVGHHTGEDIYFQVWYKRMGGKIWCEPNINMGHIGIKEWKGNYQEHLLATRTESEGQCESA